MTLYFEQNDQENVTPMRRPYRPNLNALAGDDGIEGRFNNAPLSLAPVWQTTPQEWQPPTLRFWQRYAGIMRADVVSRAEFGSGIIPFAGGWEVLAFQPPVPFVTSKARMLGGSTARGDDGIASILIPPWQFATPLKTFPDVQSRADAAIPSYNAGPQVGSIKSMPNITTPTLLKAGPGTLFSIITVAAGTTAGAVYDSNSIAGAVAANEISPIPTSGGPIFLFEWPCQYGIVVIPGAGQILSVKWV
jgi:hypothetical protein